MKRLARIAFWTYAIALFIATHWPNARIEWHGVSRPDLYIHMTLFGTWTLLLIATGYLAPAARSPLAETQGVRGWIRIVARPMPVILAALTAYKYAAIDELLQGIPALGRTVAWDDYLANGAGITLVAIVMLIAGYQTRRRSRSCPARSKGG